MRALTRQADQLERRAARAGRRLPAGAAGRAGLRGADRGAADRPHRRRGAVPLRRLLRLPVRDRADPLLLGAAHPAPARPRRGPPAQPRAAHDRDHPRPTRPRHQGVPRPQRSRGQDQEGRAALPQAPPRAPLLPPARRAATPAQRTSQAARASPGPRARQRPSRDMRARLSRAQSPNARPRSQIDPAHHRRAEPDGLHHLAAGRLDHSAVCGALPPRESPLASKFAADSESPRSRSNNSTALVACHRFDV